MNKTRLVIAFIVLIMSGNALNAQILKHFKLFDIGLGVDRIDVNSDSDKLTLFHLVSGFNLPIVELTDESSLGISPSWTLTFLGANREGKSISNNSWFGNTVPVFVHYKYGTDASLQSQTRLGFAVGAGYRYSWLHDYAWGAPAVMGEVNFKLGSKGLIKLRYMTDFGATDPTHGTTFQQQSVSILVTPYW